MTNMLHDRFVVQDEHPSQANALILNQHTVVSTHLVRDVTKERYINIPQPSILSRHILPVPQRMLGIDADENDLTISVFKLIKTVLESEDFGRTDEAKSCGYEEHDKPLRLLF